jgi:hypothetical protein
VTETNLSPASKTELLERMRVERAAWDALVAQVPERSATEPLLPNGWSVKDLIAHVAAYEEWRAQRITEDLAGGQPPAADAGSSDGEGTWDTDTINAMIYEQHKDDDLPTVQAFAARSFREMIAAFEAAPDEYLRKPTWWTGGPSVLEMVPAQTYEHYAEHTDDLRAIIAEQAR